MSFSNALYYPYIDIKDKGFIVNIALFWEAVSTIVPRGYREPYSIYESKALADAYILRPLYVEPGMSEVLEAENAALEFFESPATSLILSPKTKAHISSRWDTEETKSLLYPDKMSRKLVEQLVERGQARWQQNQLITSSRFSTFYMTLLAAILSRRQRLALLTGEEKFDQLSSAVKRGDAPTGIPNDDHLAAGLLAYLTIDALKVDPETPIDKIITFRRQYSDELTEFRNGVNELASEVGTGHESIRDLQEHIRYIHVHRITPAINDLKSSLHSATIRHIAAKLLTVGITASSLAAIGDNQSALVGVAGTAALTLVERHINFRLSRKEELRHNPYSYILRLQRTFAKAKCNP